MVAVIDISGLSAKDVLFAPSPLAELAAALHALCEPAHHPALAEWAIGVSASLPPELRSKLRAAESLWRSARADFLVPGKPAGTLAEELDELDGLSDDRYVSAALASQRAYSNGRAEKSPLSDPHARTQAMEAARARGPEQAEFAERLLAETTTTRHWVRQLLVECDDAFFGEVWKRVRPQLEIDVATKRELLAVRGLKEALEATSEAIGLIGQDRIVIDKLQDVSTHTAGHGLTLIPTAFGDPHVVVVFSDGWRPVIQYPTGENVASRTVSIALVQRRLSALANPVRMRLCRTLARGPHTTGELAAYWRLSAPEVSRHLAVLNKAGLLTTERRGRYVHYSLDLSTSAELGTDFLDMIQR